MTGLIDKVKMMRFAESHEWIALEGDVGVVGVSDYAQKELGDIVYVELPDVGAQVTVGQEVVVLESTKAAADVYSPVSGEITEVNETLADQSELVNQSPFENGWLFKIKLSDSSELEKLMDETAYTEFVS